MDVKIIRKTGGIITNGSNVIGEIVERQKHFLKVQILYPYSAWDNFVSISGPGRMTPRHFLTDYGLIRAHQLLDSSYLRLKIIDENIENIVFKYYEVQEYLTLIKHSVGKKEIESIGRKLMDNFYRNYVFKTSQTKLYCSYSDKDQIEKIIKIYRETGMKLYLSSMN